MSLYKKFISPDAINSYGTQIADHICSAQLLNEEASFVVPNIPFETTNITNANKVIALIKIHPADALVVFSVNETPTTNVTNVFMDINSELLTDEMGRIVLMGDTLHFKSLQLEPVNIFVMMYALGN